MPYIIIAIWLALIGGWIANLVKFIDLLGGPLTSWFVDHLVGVFVLPLGSLLGYL